MASYDVVILGAGGMLGQALSAHLTARGVGHLALTSRTGNVTDPAHLRAAVAAGAALVNCSAYTAVDRAESEPTRAYAVNALAVGQLGELAAQAGRYVLHVSTDFVYDGLKPAPYTEADTPAPLSTYGRSKLLGEELLRSTGCAHAIVRVQWTYGAGGQHFVSKIAAAARQRLAAAAGGTPQPLSVVADQLGAPTHTADMAAALAHLLALRATGLYLYAAAGSASRAEVARFMLARRGLAVPVLDVPTVAFPAPARRPLNSRFDCTKLDALRGPARPAWQTALAAFLETCP